MTAHSTPALRSRAVAGVGLAAAGALCYGIATVLGRGLAHAGVDSATALGVRFAVAATCLLVGLRMRGVPARPARGQWSPIVALGAIGYTLESTLFYLSLQRGTAAACILLFYAYPAIVTVIELAKGGEAPHPLTLCALGLSLGGVALVVAAGGDVAITSGGVVLALGAAAAYAVYLVLGRGVGRGTDAMATALWIAVGAATASLGRALLTDGLATPADQLPALLAYGIATAGAFALTFAALARICAGSTAVVMTLEAACTVVLAAAFLGESVTTAQAAGGAAILAAAALIARRHHSDARSSRSSATTAAAAAAT